MSKTEHHWTGKRIPGTPHSPEEYVEYCEDCGMENPGSSVDLSLPQYCCACGGSGVMEGDPSAPDGSILRYDVPCPECQKI